MQGFDGDPQRAARLRETLHLVLRAFPEHLARSQTPTVFEAYEMEWNAQFDAILRAHKKDRLAIPVQALFRVGAAYHNFELMPLRRLAWFVPSLLAAWLDRTAVAEDLERVFASTAIVEGDYWSFSEDEAGALATFFDAALLAALATELPPERAPAVARPLEDGLAVWSVRAPSVPLDVLRVARTMHVPVEPLVLAWVHHEDALALDHLLEAVFDPTAPAKRLLAHEPVVERLGEAFFAATGDRALRLSKAEKLVRRWVARRADEDLW